MKYIGQHWHEKYQKEYFDKVLKLKQENPKKKGREIWEIVELDYDCDIYSSYGSFRTSLHTFQKKQRQCKK
jgi:hypothetical protein